MSKPPTERQHWAVDTRELDAAALSYWLVRSGRITRPPDVDLLVRVAKGWNRLRESGHRTGQQP